MHDCIEYASLCDCVDECIEYADCSYVTYGWVWMNEGEYAWLWQCVTVWFDVVWMNVDEWVMSHMNESFHKWMSPVIYELVMSRVNECGWIRNSMHDCVTVWFDAVWMNVDERVMSHMNESCNKWMTSVTYNWIMPHIWMRHVTFEWVMLLMNESCHLKMVWYCVDECGWMRSQSHIHMHVYTYIYVHMCVYIDRIFLISGTWAYGPIESALCSNVSSVRQVVNSQLYRAHVPQMRNMSILMRRVSAA
jgi:hypothetical protein